ncbi:uncharacterized protein F5147DRAFT_587506 [Suillus discolor]|uniref:Uncharacterized protein n=1 Tax=Suillus discolor TaxID=1912936 RepID=A0A9P7EST3_9AGAM|nr:uncharacterized protein F5147DRAFT_587506 [Suillus discolor]KAG2088740.1 hypothetical protein F5147DRAFT_587506 [Suillus discolor]
MPRIRSDPNLNLCPDYNLEDFANTRAQLVNDNTTEEQAVQLLRNIWLANNNLDKRLWQQQLENDREELVHQRRMEEDEQERLKQERINEEEDTCKEEPKKNKHKYIPIQNSGVPDDPAVTPCSYALCKLDKGEYLELWYFTNSGLDEVSTKKTVDDDAMILSSLPDGSTAWTYHSRNSVRRVLVS